MGAHLIINLNIWNQVNHFPKFNINRNRTALTTTPAAGIDEATPQDGRRMAARGEEATLGATADRCCPARPARSSPESPQPPNSFLLFYFFTTALTGRDPCCAPKPRLS